MNKEVLTMVICPYCSDEWILDDQLVCSKCEPKFKTDMIISDLIACVEALNETKELSPNRFKLLDEAIDNLQIIKKRFQET